MTPRVTTYTRECIPRIEARDDCSDEDGPFEGLDDDDKDVHMWTSLNLVNQKNCYQTTHCSYHTHIIATPIVNSM